MRKTPIYTLDADLGAWMEEHRGIIFDHVLESAEAAIAGEYTLSAIPVIILQSEGGTSLFMLKSVQSTQESLEKAMAWFVSVEEYEKAARARDTRQRVIDMIWEENI